MMLKYISRTTCCACHRLNSLSFPTSNKQKKAKEILKESVAFDLFSLNYANSPTENLLSLCLKEERTAKAIHFIKEFEFHFNFLQFRHFSHLAEMIEAGHF